MEEIDGEEAVFVVVAEDVGVVALLGGGDALLFLQLVHGRELIAQTCGGLKLLGFCGGHHAGCERAFKFGVAAFEEELRVADGLLVCLGSDEAFDAGAEAAVDVVLQAGARMVAREIDLAAWDEEAAMDELDDAIGEVAGEVGSVIGGAVFAETARDEDLGEAVAEGEFHVGVGLVVAQQNVEARLALLDEIVFKRESFVFVGDEDVVEIDGLAHERAGFCVGLRRFEQIGADPRAEILRLAHVDDFAVGILVEINARLGGKGSDFLVEVHRRSALKKRQVFSIAGKAESPLEGKLQGNPYRLK